MWRAHTKQGLKTSLFMTTPNLTSVLHPLSTQNLTFSLSNPDQKLFSENTYTRSQEQTLLRWSWISSLTLSLLSSAPWFGFAQDLG